LGVRRLRARQKNQVVAKDWVLAQKVNKTIVHFDHLLSNSVL